MAGLVVRVLGDLPSTIVFIFSQRDALALASLMTGKPIGDGRVIGDLERSALKRDRAYPYQCLLRRLR